MKLSIKHTTIYTSIALCGFVLATHCSSKKDNQEETNAALLVLASGFVDNQNGTVTQNQNLTWMKCSQGQVWSAQFNNCAGTGGGTTYGAQSLKFCATLTGNYADCTTSDAVNPTANSGPAYDSCNNLSFAGFTDWRLPTKGELETMTANINRDAFLYLFPQTPDDKAYWSSTGNKDQSDGSEAYTVYFADKTFGQTEIAAKDSVKYVRCVRP